jgi:hypothetical protein
LRAVAALGSVHLVTTEEVLVEFLSAYAGQGELVLAKNFKLIKDLQRVVDIRLRILYNRFRLHDIGRAGLEPRRTPNPPG